MRPSPTLAPATLDYPLRTHRMAVLAAFVINGFLYASWAARVPDIQAQYGVNDAAFGLVLICASGGAFASMPFAAWIIERLGVVRTSVLSALLYAAAVALMPQLPPGLTVYPLFFAMGIGFGLLDVAMNAQAVEVEKAYGRAIVTSFHAGFSAAMIAGALASSAVLYLGLDFGWHLAGAAASSLLVLAWATPRFYPYVAEVDDEAVAADQSAFRLPARPTWLLGAIGFCSMMSEASIADWTTKYMLEVADAVEYMAPWSLAAFSVTMTGGRLVGDRYRDRYGDAWLLRAGALLAFGGMAATLIYPSATTTILGSASIGLGLSVAVPIVFSLSGGIKGLSASAALSMVTTISYLGLFIGPAVIGFLSEGFGLRAGYGFVLGVLAVLGLLVWRVRAEPPP